MTHAPATDKVKRQRCIRSYELRLYPNTAKAEEMRYTLWWASRFTLDYVRQLYPLPANAKISTAGKGDLNDRCKERARGMLRAGRASARATGKSFNCPTTVGEIAASRIQVSRTPHFQFWVKVSRGPFVPAQTHRALAAALRGGGQLRGECELRRGRKGAYIVRVFVEFQTPAPTPGRDHLGCDVGVNQAVSTSDGYTARSLRPILERTRQKRAEQNRQGHHRSSARSAVKQRLDHEARRVVTLAMHGHKTLVLERLKTLGNLKPLGSIGGWARRHFGERVRQIAEIAGVAVLEVHPAYTSQTCLVCDHVDSKNRRGTEFECTRCGARGHADVVAARNLVRRARGVEFGFKTPRKGRETNTIAGTGVVP